MLTLNTNLSSLVAQTSLKTSTNKLNQAIERMTTGFKINHAKDNAANYAISTDMTTKINSYMVAEDNASMGLDMLLTAEAVLEEINDKLERLRALTEQANNGTYGAQSLKAINVECNSLVDEIERLYQSAEYNGIKLYGYEELPQTNSGSNITTFALYSQADTVADENTLLRELGLETSSFSIHNSLGGVIETYETEGSDSIGDIFDVLGQYGLTASIKDGVISLVSTNGYYISGELAESFGIVTESEETINSSTQSSNKQTTCTLMYTATESTTLAQIGVLDSGSSKITVKNKYGDTTGIITVKSTTTIGTLFDSLAAYDIQGVIEDGVIKLSSPKGNYVLSDGVIAALGITNVQGSSFVTTGTEVTSDSNVTYSVTETNGGYTYTETIERTVTTLTTTTVPTTEIQTILITTTSETTKTETIWTTTTSNVTQTLTIKTTTTTPSTMTETIWSTTTSSETKTETVLTQSVITTTVTEGMTLVSSLPLTYTSVVLGSSMVSTAPVVYTSTVYADENTWLSNLGITEDDNFMICRNGDWGEMYYSDNYLTVGDLLSTLQDDGYVESWSITNGQISVVMQGKYYFDGNIGTGAAKLGIAPDVRTVGITKTSTASVIFTETMQMTVPMAEDWTLYDLGCSYSVIGLNLMDVRGNTFTMSFRSTDTVGDVIEKIYSEYGVDFTLERTNQGGRLVFQSGSRYTFSGEVAELLGINDFFAGVDTTGEYRYRVDNVDTPVLATKDSTLSQIFGIGESEEYVISTHECKDIDYWWMDTITLGTGATTIGEMLDVLNDYGIEATFEQGKLSITCNNSVYPASLAFLNAFNISAPSVHDLYTVELTDKPPVTLTDTDVRTVTLNEETTMKELAVNAGYGGLEDCWADKTIYWNNPYLSDGPRIFYLYDSTTVGEIIEWLNEDGISASIENGKFYVEGNAGWVQEDPTNGMDPACIFSLFNIDFYDPNFSDTVTITATESITLDILGEGASITLKNIDGSTVSITIDEPFTLGNLFEKLSDYNITGSISNGIVTLAPESDWYIENMSRNLSDALKVTVGAGNSYTDIIHTETVTVPTEVTTTIYTTTTSSETKTTTTYTTTTSTVTQTLTAGTTTTTSETKTTTIYTTTTAPTTQTVTTYDTVTSSVIQTETDYITHTVDATTTTVEKTLSADTTMSQLGLASRGYITVFSDGTKTIITVALSSTAGEIVQALQQSGINASIVDGKLSLSPSAKGIYIEGISSSLVSALNLRSDFYTAQNGVECANSNRFEYTGVKVLTKQAVLSDYGVTDGNVYVIKNGLTSSTIAVSSTGTLAEFLDSLEDCGFTTSVNNGKVTLKASSDMIVSDTKAIQGLMLMAAADDVSSNILSVLNIGTAIQNKTTVYTNTDSNQLYSTDVDDPPVIVPTGSITLQVGINSDESSRITVNTGFVLEDLDKLRRIGKKTVGNYDFLAMLDSMLDKVSAKQTEIGAAQNRLESVLDEISIKYDKLVSSRSTLRDADIAEVSATYIQQQILQQASATLLATANQNPALALQLL